MLRHSNLARRARAASAPPAPALAYRRYNLFVRGRWNEAHIVIVRRTWDWHLHLCDDTRLVSCGRESQLIATKSDLGVIIVQPNSYEFLEQLHRDDPAHTARCFDSLPEFRHHGFHLPVLVVFIRQAAQQTTANSRYLRRIQWQVLVLGHVHRNLGKDRQPGRATKGSSATAETAQQSRFVARTDLSQLDAAAERACRLSGKIVQDPWLRCPFAVRNRKVQRHSRSIEAEIGGNRLETQPARTGYLAEGLKSLGTSAPMCLHAPHVVVGQSSRDAAQVALDLRLANLMRGKDYPSRLFTASRGHNDPVANEEIIAIGSEVIDTPRIPEPNADHTYRRRGAVET